MKLPAMGVEVTASVGEVLELLLADEETELHQVDERADVCAVCGWEVGLEETVIIGGLNGPMRHERCPELDTPIPYRLAVQP